MQQVHVTKHEMGETVSPQTVTVIDLYAQNHEYCSLWVTEEIFFSKKFCL